LVKAITSGKRLAGCLDKARITAASSAELNLSFSRADFSGIGGSVSSCVNISLGAFAVYGRALVNR
jgi:hypothetical protein